MSGVIQMVSLVQGMFLSSPTPGVHVTSRTDCVSRCYWSRSCSSVFYSSSSLTCHLVNTVYLTSELQVSPDTSIHYWVWQSDGSFCGDGYTWDDSIQMCYKLYTTRRYWDSAHAQCQQDGGRLVKVDTGAKNDVMYQLADVAGYWLFTGGTRTAPSMWSWGDGTEFSESYWDTYQPSSTTLADCMCIGSPAQINADNTRWHAGYCTFDRAFVCEIPWPKCN